MADVVTWNSSEANTPKTATTFNDFTYDTTTDGGCLTKLDEVNKLINAICTDVQDIGQKYTMLQALYNTFTGYNDLMNANTASLCNSFNEIQQGYQMIMNEMNNQIGALQQNDATLMTDLEAINQQLTGVSDGGADEQAAALLAAQQAQASAQSAQEQAAAEAQAQAEAAQAALAAQQLTDTTAGFMPSAGTGTGVGTLGGFVMPTGQNLETVYKIIAAEGGNISPNEAMNIASTMINRARTGGWSGGNDIYKIATAKNQYVVYQNGNYASASLSPESRAAVDTLFASAAAGGGTVHPYSSFRSNGSTGYNGVVLEPGGNRYA